MKSSYTLTRNIPSDDEYSYSPDISINFKEHWFILTVFKDNTPVTPSNGVATLEVTDDNHNWGTLEQSTIDLSDAAYKRPNLRGPISKARIKFLNVPLSEVNRFKLVIASKE